MAVELVQLVKRLLHPHKDLTSVPITSVETKLSIIHVQPQRLKAENGGDSWGSLVSHSSQTGEFQVL